MALAQVETFANCACTRTMFISGLTGCRFATGQIVQFGYFGRLEFNALTKTGEPACPSL